MLPMADSGRLVLGFYWVFVIAIVATYTGNLVAFLTFPVMETPIDSIENLMERRESDNMAWGIPRENFIKEHVKVVRCL